MMESQDNRMPRMLAALLVSGVALVVAASGEATGQSLSESPEEDGGIKEASQCDGGDCLDGGVNIGCGTGGCDPDKGNGRGIYVVEGGNYCVPYLGPDEVFCPEAFSSTTEGVVLGGYIEGRRTKIYQGRHSLRVQGIIKGQAVELTGLSAVGTNLVVSYKSPLGTVQNVSGQNLELIKFTLQDARGANYEMGFTLRSPDNGVQQYTVQIIPKTYHYSQPSYCQDQNGNATTVSFLPGRQVDHRTASVTTTGNLVTMACDTGAIVSCLKWGYRPWEAPAKLIPQRRNDLFGACMQAKRAAYLGGTRSYTRNGTPIMVRDSHVSKGNLPNRLEAYWTPSGAACLNRENRRHPEIPLPVDAGPPPCANYTPQPDWLLTGLPDGGISSQPLPGQ
jgi:hypothetical protein